MKISYRILLINFVIVVIVFASSTLTFYTVTKKIVTSQHSKNLLNSSKDFVFDLQTALGETDSDFAKFLASYKGQKNIALSSMPALDFIFKANSDSSISPEVYYFRNSDNSSKEFRTLSDFFKIYPNCVIKKLRMPSGETLFYGRILSEEFLNGISKRIRADIAVVQNNTTVAASNSQANKLYYSNIAKAAGNLFSNSGYEISMEELPSADFYATWYRLTDWQMLNGKVNFLVFSTLPEAAQLRETFNNILIVIGFTGVALSLILVLIFTEKIRKQITHLSKAADITRSGNLNHRVSMITKDELGRLGMAFNNMLDELEQNEKAKNDYTEFITLINQNPTLREVSDAVLTKIINATGLTVGRLYMIDEDEPKLLSSYRLENETSLAGSKVDLYRRVVEKGEEVEFNFTENFPVVHSGLIELSIRYLLIFPVIYNKKVIAILELASITPPRKGVREYLANIKDQLAIGLSNANAFRQLENLVQELKILNEEYQKQNEQVIAQNKTLLELHAQIKEKAEELEVQKEKAVGSTKLKSQFLASMSHELRTPLNVILGLTEVVLSDTKLYPEGREKLEVVHRNSYRLMKLINDILDFSKIEAGKIEIIKENFHLKELVSEIEAQIRPLADEKKLNFVVHNDISKNPVINADKFKITQVLINLLGNAVKFTERGMVILKANLNDDKLQFRVVDTGIGISEENIKIIFEEFRQVDGTSTRKYNGTGLGLAISKRYTELLKGSLTCESEPGKGSAFTFIVPVSILENSESDLYNEEPLKDETITMQDEEMFYSEPASQQQQPDVPETIASEMLKMENERRAQHTILIADGNGENRKVINRYFTSKHYNVKQTGSMAEALREISEKRPFAVTLSVSPNDQAPWDTLRKLKENEQTCGIPVVLYSTVEPLNFGYGLQVHDYIFKALNAKVLNPIIERLSVLLGREIRNIICAGFEDQALEALKGELNEKPIKITSLIEQNAAFKMIAKLQPELVLIDAFMQKGDSISFIDRLKTSFETRDIPVILCLKPEISSEEFTFLNSSIEKVTIRSKAHRIDILKAIRDRINLEEGFPQEDTSSILIENKTEDGELPEGEGERKLPSNKVLIVDDDTDTLFTVGEIVRKTGCETVLAKNGLECLTALQTLKPDLILLDIMMPQMDGFETIKRIRAEKNLKDIPVFALTALEMIEEKEILIRNGFDDFVSKPVDSGSLSFKIEKVINNIAELEK